MQSTDPFSSTRQQKRDLGPRAGGNRGTLLPPQPRPLLMFAMEKTTETGIYNLLPFPYYRQQVPIHNL